MNETEASGLLHTMKAPSDASRCDRSAEGRVLPGWVLRGIVGRLAAAWGAAALAVFGFQAGAWCGEPKDEAAVAAGAAATAEFNIRGLPPHRQSYLRLADEIESHFQKNIVEYWFPRVVDRQFGGFRPHVLTDGAIGPNNDKTLVYQSRMTWVAAQIALREPSRADEFRGYVRHGIKLLREVLADRDHGGLYWGLDQSGKFKPDWRDEKHAYGIAFAIYAASAAYEATRDADALQLAKDTFRWFDRHAHDAEHGGYYEALSRRGEVLRHAPPGRQRDLLGTPYGFKSMNSHIHLLEAVTALYEVWPDPLVEQRLGELLEVVRDKVAVEPGCLNLYFTPAWRPVPEHDSFGHDVETAYLLIEASAALGRKNDAATHRMARMLVDHALEYGWDARHGGFYDRGFAFGPAYATEKIWWTQAEGLNALLLMHRLHGGQTTRYWEAFLHQWEFIVRYQTDAEHGEWFESVSHDGRPKPGQAKATIWKAAYHNGRALMNTAAMLRQLAGNDQNQAPPH